MNCMYLESKVSHIFLRFLQSTCIMKDLFWNTTNIHTGASKAPCCASSGWVDIIEQANFGIYIGKNKRKAKTFVRSSKYRIPLLQLHTLCLQILHQERASHSYDVHDKGRVVIQILIKIHC